MIFSCAWTKASAVFMGASLFLLAVSNFGMTALRDRSVTENIFCLFLPLLIVGGYIALLHILHWDAPGIYAMLGAGLCLVFLVDVFFSGSVLRMILGVVWYPICAAVLVLAVGGYFPGKLPATLFFGVSIVIRLLLLVFGKPNLVGLFSEGAMLCAMAGLMCLPMAMVPVHIKQK